MTPPPQPLIPGIDEVRQRLSQLPVITGQPEQFASSPGSGPVDLSKFPQYGGLEMRPPSAHADNFAADAHSDLIAKTYSIGRK